MSTCKSSRSGRSKSSIQPLRPGGVVDLEMNCLICRKRLYVPDTSREAMLTALEQTGAVVLICPNGHAQLIEQKMPPAS